MCAVWVSLPLRYWALLPTVSSALLSPTLLSPRSSSPQKISDCAQYNSNTDEKIGLEPFLTFVSKSNTGYDMAGRGIPRDTKFPNAINCVSALSTNERSSMCVIGDIGNIAVMGGTISMSFAVLGRGYVLFTIQTAFVERAALAVPYVRYLDQHSHRRRILTHILRSACLYVPHPQCDRRWKHDPSCHHG